MGVFEWFKEAVPQSLEVKQVYGVLFDEYGRTLVRTEVINGKKYGCLAGGKPEIGDDGMDGTLRREAIEEVNTTLKEIYYLGYQTVNEGNGIPVYAQVRMIGLIDKIGPKKPDPDGGKIYDRILTTPERAIEILSWGEEGKKMIRDATELAKIKFNFKEIKTDEEFV